MICLHCDREVFHHHDVGCPDYDKPIPPMECKHGHLARKCNQCDDEQEIERLRAELDGSENMRGLLMLDYSLLEKRAEKAEAERDALKVSGPRGYAEKIERLMDERDAVIAKLAKDPVRELMDDILPKHGEAAASIRELKARVERLRKAIEDAPHDERVCAWVRTLKAWENTHNYRGELPSEKTCNCWKREALAEDSNASPA